MEGKTNVSRLMRYHDTSLIYQDAEALHALESFMKKPIPVISDMNYNTFGFAAQDCRVVQLGLCGNKLNSLPDCIKNLTALTTLNLNHNMFTTFPDCIVNLHTLTTLDVSHNNLTSTLGLPPSINYLQIAFNNLSSLEGIPPYLPLDELDIIDNNLEHFGSMPLFNQSPIYFTFEGNPLRSLHGLSPFLLYEFINSIRKVFGEEVPPSQQTYREDFYFSPLGSALIEQCVFSFHEIGAFGDCFDLDDLSNPVTNAINTLYTYYHRSPTDLADAYTHNPASLTEEEYNRLKHEGSGIERDILLTKLPPTDPVVKAIMTRLIVQMKSGYSLIL